VGGTILLTDVGLHLDDPSGDPPGLGLGDDATGQERPGRLERRSRETLAR
jgi:hypothetical protein